MNNPAISMILQAYLVELKNNYSSYSSEHAGKLNLGIDEREDIKCLHVKPITPNYDKFKTLMDEGVHPSDEDFIQEFEAAAESMLVSLEEQAIQTITTLVNGVIS